MSFQVIFNKIEIEKVNKGKTGYEKATVHYSYQGQARSQAVVSFSNPAVYDAVTKLNEGDVIEVETVKNGNFTNWSSVKRADGAATNSPKRVESAKPTGSWETAEERAYKQALIVRQSCLAQAVATVAVDASHQDVVDLVPIVLEIAQDYVDWVMQVDQEAQGS